MDHRSLVLALASTLLPAAAAAAEGIAIDHKPVGCIVAGSYPRLNACFAPSSSLARARVYFRVADATPEWYYVEMRSDAPCFAGILPKPRKQLIGRKVQYYVDAFDRSFAEARTDEAQALVVARKSDCDSKLPVAPLLPKASVVVFPGVPDGFAAAAGLSTGTTALIVGAGAALAGGVAVAAGHSGSGGSPTGGGPAPPDTLPPPPPTTTTTTTTTLLGFNPVFKVSKNGVPVDYTKPISGTEPLTLTIDMCDTIGPYPLRFSVAVDGVSIRDTCKSTVTFTTVSAATGPGSPVHASAGSRTYGLQMSIHSVASNNDPKASRSTTVQVDGNSCTGDTQGPTVALTLPRPGSTYPSPAPYPVHFEASASDSTTGNNGISLVEYKVNAGMPDQVVLTASGSSPYPVDWSEAAVDAWIGSVCTKIATLQAYAVDGCGNSTLSKPITVTLFSTSLSCIGFLSRPAAEHTATWQTELTAPGASGQVVVNGEAVFPREGRTAISVRPQAGVNRIEGTLVEARSGGAWRFELGAIPGLRPDSLRVVAGDVVQAAADAVVFRLQGRPGERVVFSFEVEP